MTPSAFALRKARFSSEQTYWLGALTLPWRGTFLPHDRKEDAGGRVYEGGLLTIDQAVQAGAKGPWKLDPKPTLVVAWNPSKRAHVRFLGELEKNKDFSCSSHYFNLLRIDLRSVKDRAVAKEIGRGPTVFLYDVAGKRVGDLEKARMPKDVLKLLAPVFELDYGRPFVQAVEAMGAALARKAWVDRQILEAEKGLIDPKTGAVDQAKREKLNGFRRHVKELKEHKQGLLRLAARRKAA